MHYCVLLLTKRFPIESDIAEIMKPYDEEKAVYSEDGETRIDKRPLFEFDWYQIGGRYSGLIKLRIDRENKDYDWNHYAKADRNGRLFHSCLLKKVKKNTRQLFLFREEDFYTSMGANDGFLYVDGAKISDILNYDKIDCCNCIGSDGEVIARSSWDGEEWISDDDFDKKLLKMKNDYADGFATILDIHD
jgi:hypothetical protein